MCDQSRCASEHEALSLRELDVVRLLVEGLANQAIANELGITRRTVQAHVASAMRKSRTVNRTELAVFALRRRLVPLDVEGSCCHGLGRS